MSVVVVGLNHRSAPLEVLESTSVPAEALPKALGDLAGRAHLEELLVVSTCMRTEVYVTTDRFHPALGDVRDFLALWSGRPPEDLSGALYDFHETRAARHLLRVAAGLDSAVLGEGEILRQVRTAADAARVARTLGPVLDGLVRRAVETGKRVRSETAISRGATSLSHTAVALAGERLAVTSPDRGEPCPGAAAYAGRRALVVGAGEVGTTLACLLCSAPGVGAMAVANRTPGRAADAARSAGAAATPVAWEALPEALGRADAVFCATDSPRPVLDAGLVAARGGRPLVVVDLGVPRNVEPAVGALPGVVLLDLQDIEERVGSALSGRRAEVPAAEAIVEEELGRWVELANQRAVAAPVVAALHQRAEELRSSELARAAPRLAGLEPAQARAVEALTRGLVAKLLHDPTVKLKAASADARGRRLAEALTELFDLDP